MMYGNLYYLPLQVARPCNLFEGYMQFSKCNKSCILINIESMNLYIEKNDLIPTSKYVMI